MARVINQHKRPSGAFCGWSGTEVSDTYPEAGCVGPSVVRFEPCPDSRVLCPASEVKPGDSVDVSALPYRLGEVARMVAECEYAQIVEESTVETPDCIVIHTDNGSYGVKPDLVLTLGPHQSALAES